MLKKLCVQNYCQCKNLVFEPHSHFSALVGPNGSGKTTILNSVRLLNNTLHRGPLDDIHNAPRNSEVKIQAEYKIGRAKIIQYCCTKSDTGREEDLYYFNIWDIETPEFTVNNYVLRESEKGVDEKLVIAKRYVKKVHRYMEGVYYYATFKYSNPQDSATYVEVPKDEYFYFMKFMELNDYEQFIFRIYESYKNRKHEFLEFLEVVGPLGMNVVEDIYFSEQLITDKAIPRKVVENKTVETNEIVVALPLFKTKGGNVLANQLSSGTYKILALVYNIMQTKSKILLIEEPEACIHYGLLSSLVELLKLYSKKKQVIVTTHSDLILNHIAPNNVYVTRNTQEDGILVNSIESVFPENKYNALRLYLKSEGNLGEYWRSGGMEI